MATGLLEQIDELTDVQLYAPCAMPVINITENKPPVYLGIKSGVYKCRFLGFFQK